MRPKANYTAAVLFIVFLIILFCYQRKERDEIINKKDFSNTNALLVDTGKHSN